MIALAGPARQAVVPVEVISERLGHDPVLVGHEEQDVVRRGHALSLLDPTGSAVTDAAGRLADDELGCDHHRRTGLLLAPPAELVEQARDRMTTDVACREADGRQRGTHELGERVVAEPDHHRVVGNRQPALTQGAIQAEREVVVADDEPVGEVAAVEEVARDAVCLVGVPRQRDDADFTLNRLYTCAADRMGYCNEELDEILAQARSSLDPDERIELYAEASQIMWDDAVGIFPADLRINAAYRSNVQGFELPTNNRPSFATVSIED